MNMYMRPLTEAVVASGDKDVELAGLQLVETELTKLRKGVTTLLDNYQPDHFERDAKIEASSFGGNDRAAVLGNHHERAHQVMYRTLAGLDTDLHDFLDACENARLLLSEVDATAAADLTGTNAAVDALALGSFPDDTEREHDNARNNRAGSEDV